MSQWHRGAKYESPCSLAVKSHARGDPKLEILGDGTNRLGSLNTKGPYQVSKSIEDCPLISHQSKQLWCKRRNISLEKVFSPHLGDDCHEEKRPDRTANLNEDAMDSCGHGGPSPNSGD
jgi:hypothetical protein